MAVATVSFHRYSPAVKATPATCWAGAALYILVGAHDALAIRTALFPEI